MRIDADRLERVDVGSPDCSKPITVYYAGLDEHALPLGESTERLAELGEKATAYVKLLTLFADHVILPPSFFIGVVRNRAIQNSLVRNLAPLYQAGLVSSPIGGDHNLSTDFLELKLSQDRRDRAPGPTQVRTLEWLFREIPVVRRDVRTQSRGFRERVMPLVERMSERSGAAELAREALIRIEDEAGIALSRSHAYRELRRLLVEGRATQREYRRLYHTVTSSYYVQGAATYDAVVSMPRVAEHSPLGRHVFSGGVGKFAIGYDPELLEMLLQAHGIALRSVAVLSSAELLSIRGSRPFRRFKACFQEFTARCQRIWLACERYSRASLERLKQRIFVEFEAEFARAQQIVETRRHLLGIVETGGWAVGLGTLGFFITPLLGLVLAAVPVVLLGTGASPRATDLVLEHVDRGEAAFQQYLTYLAAVCERLEGR